METAGLTFLDYGVITIMVLSTLFAFIRGFIGSFLSLAGWALSIYLAYTMFPVIKPFLDEKIKSPIVVIVAGHTALLIGFLIAFGIINLICTSAVKGLTSGIIDRTLGGAFGAARGAIIVSFLFFVVATAVTIFNGDQQDNKGMKDDAMPKWLSSSKTYPFMKEGSEVLASVIPDSFYTRFQEMYDDISKKSMDERFVDTSIQKIRKTLNPKDIQDVDQQTDEAALTQSSEEAKYTKMKKILDTYEAKKDTMGKDGKTAVSDQEMDRLRKIIKSKETEIKTSKPKVKSAEELEEGASE
jgi:membrane protein required for colicin V production